MKLSNIFLYNAILTTIALAAPQTSHNLVHQVRPRAASARRSNAFTPTKNDSSTIFSPNWAGASIDPPPIGQTFNYVIGQFTLPTPSCPPGSSGDSCGASVWVGIDGDKPTRPLLQAGISLEVSNTGIVSYQAWSEWVPNFEFFDNFSMSAGDEISISVKAVTPSEGIVTVTNISTGQSVSRTLDAPDSTQTLIGQSAEWIVEDYGLSGSLVPFANFGTVIFTNCAASTESETHNLDNAFIWELDQAGQALTNVVIASPTEFSIQYNEAKHTMGRLRLYKAGNGKQTQGQDEV